MKFSSQWGRTVNIFDSTNENFLSQLLLMLKWPQVKHCFRRSQSEACHVPGYINSNIFIRISHCCLSAIVDNNSLLNFFGNSLQTLIETVRSWVLRWKKIIWYSMCVRVDLRISDYVNKISRASIDICPKIEIS